MLRTIALLVATSSWAVGGLCQAEDAPKVIAAGGWSKPVANNRGRALRGRLVVCEQPRGDDLREVAVYVELQDASEAKGGSIQIFCDFGKTDFRPEYKSGLRCELRDKDQRPVEPKPFAFGGGVPSSEWVTLPADATIRLRSSPFGIRRAKALAIAPDAFNMWVIDDSDKNEHFLSGTFTVAPGEGNTPPGDGDVWRGVLELPAARIATGGEVASAEQDGGRIGKAIGFVKKHYNVPTERIDDRTIGVIWESGAEKAFEKLRDYVKKEFDVDVRITAQE